MAIRKEATDPPERLRALLAKQHRQFRKVFLDAIDTFKSNIILTELADMIENGRLAEALSLVDEAAQLLGNASASLLAESANDTAQWLSSEALVATISFDQTNTRAVQAMSTAKLDMVREFSQDQRQMLRQTLVDGVTDGLNPREQARRFRSNIGLTARQQKAVANYERLLGTAGTETDQAREALTRRLRNRQFDGQVERAIRNNKPLTKAQIDRMVEAYKSRYVKYRSEVIGRTEALRSVHEGNEEMYKQAFTDGHLAPENLLRTWNTGIDGRERDSHRALHKVKLPYGELFGGILRHPGDSLAPAEETIQCRCVLSTRVRRT